MLRWARGNIRLAHIRNDTTWKEAHENPVETFLENKNNKVVRPLFEARTQPHMCEIAKTRSLWQKDQRATEKEMKGQPKGRHGEMPTN